MSGLMQFLLARVAEDEAAAQLAIADGMPRKRLAEVAAKRRIIEEHRHGERWRKGDTWISAIVYREGDEDKGWVYEPPACLAVLAAVYVDHPDYDEAWRPWPVSKDTPLN